MTSLDVKSPLPAAEGHGPLDAVRAVGWLVIFVVIAVVLLPAQAVCHALRLPVRHAIPIFFHRFVLKALGARLTIRGEMTPHRPILLAPNHVSWTDIMVLGSLGPMSFVAKSEVANWPIFGYFAKLQRSIFVDRDRRTATPRTRAEMVERLREGDPLVLFAEGTSSDGNRVLRFRATLIGAAESLAQATGETVWIQPVALAYRRVAGLPAGRQHRLRVAWIGDIDLLPHAWALLKDGALDVDVIFGDPVPFDPTADRKSVALFLERRVRALHSAALTGREDDLPPIVRR